MNKHLGCGVLMVILVSVFSIKALPLTIEPIGNRRTAEGELLQFDIRTDSPGGTIWSTNNLPAGSIFTPGPTEAQFRWTPGYGEAGVYGNITFEASTGGMDLARETIKIWVEDVPQPGTGHIKGLVTGIGGRYPLAGAVVGLSGPTSLVTSTDSHGYYAFEDVPAGPGYAVEATFQDFVTVVHDIPGVPERETVISDFRLEVSPDNMPPSAPTDVRCSGWDEGIDVVWDPVPDPDLFGYHVERRAVLDLLWFQVSAGTLKSNFHQDRTAVPGIEYVYRVVAHDLGGMMSDPSDESLPGLITELPPRPVADFRVELLTGGGIILRWTRSASSDIHQYNVYWNDDVFAGEVDYLALPKAVVMFPETSLVVAPGVISMGVPVVIGIRAEDLLGLEEKNTDIVIRVVTRGDFNMIPSVSLRSPYAGKRISGNNITLYAEIVGGDPVIAKQMIQSVNFEVKPVYGDEWAGIISANPGNPNGDVAPPYFVSWNTTAAVPPGDYWIRTIVTSRFGDDIAAVWTKVVVVDQAEGFNNESVGLSAKTKLEEIIEAGRTNYQFIGSPDSDIITHLSWSEGATGTDTVVGFTHRDPETMPLLQEVDQLSADLAFDVELGNGATILDGTGVQIVSGWEDEDDDGVLDGNCVGESDLELYLYDYEAGSGKGEVGNQVLDGTGDLYLVASQLEENMNQFLAELTQVGNYVILAASGSKVYITSRLPAYSFSGKRLLTAGSVTIQDGTGLVQYTVNSADKVSPNGIPESATANYLAPGLDKYSLVGKLGPEGTTVKIGTSPKTFTSTGPAKLYLGFNDNTFSDNTNLILMNAEVSLFPEPTPTPPPITTGIDEFRYYQ